ncbi:MAG: folate-binding protein YgfZ [Elusimicrobia bacterium]|nr:folate-binding protein YgfZ [Elusimicrobiota bacterium]
MIEADPEEYRAAGESLILARVRLGVLRLRGPDCRDFLHGLVTADIRRLQPGQWTPASLLTPKGRLAADFAVYARGDELLTLQRPGATEPLVKGLSKSILLTQTSLEDASAETGSLWLAGPQAPAALPVLGFGRPPAGCASAAWGGLELSACRADFWGAGHALLWRGPSPAGLEEALLAAVAGARRAGEGTLEALRVEAGVPALGVDTDPDTFPLELGEAGISFDKGCYLGQETTAKMKNLGHPNRKLVRLRLEGRAEAGWTLLAGGDAVGRLTSVVGSPRGATGLALVRLAHARTGARLDVAEGPVQATVVE